MIRLGQSTFKIAVKIKEILICKSHLLTEKSLVLEWLLTKENDMLSIWDCNAGRITKFPKQLGSIQGPASGEKKRLSNQRLYNDIHNYSTVCTAHPLRNIIV